MDVESLAELAIRVVVFAVGAAAAFNIAGAAERMSRSAAKSLSPNARRGDRFVTSVRGTRLIGALLMVGVVASLIWPTADTTPSSSRPQDTVVPVAIGVFAVVFGLVLALNVRGSAAYFAKGHREGRWGGGDGYRAKTTTGVRVSGLFFIAVGVAFISSSL